MKLYEDLKWRGLIKDISSPDLKDKLNNEKITFYLGTDPTADSLHVGHLAAFLTAKRLNDAGHRCILLVGGATGRIGDPRPNSEREIIDDEIFEHNLNSLKKQVEIFGCDEVVDNYEWSKEINFIDFLRDYGKHFSVNYMLNKDIVRRRLDTGITYTEFSYMIMQALDFLHLYETKNCVLQVAGSDQWGNITSGIELIKRKLGKEAYGFCMPLVLDENGNKIGKSEGNAVWIDQNKTSSYDLYQYFIRTPDIIAIDYLKYFTFLKKDEIEEYELKLKQNPEKREAQKSLAFEVVKFLHGKDKALEVQKASDDAFSGNTDNLPIINLDKQLLTEEFNICDLLAETNICTSKSEARRLVEQGGIKLNNEKITNPKELIKMTDEIIIHRGKKNIYRIVIK